MASYSDVAEIVRQNVDLFRKPGVLSVRPGFHMDAGWPTGNPLIVVTVGSKKGEAAA